MKNILKIIVVLIPIVTLTSCDAMLIMTYSVENKSSQKVKLFIPGYPVDSVLSIYGKRKDTVLVLNPDEEIIVGIGSKLDFPWATKNIYKTNPGICGLQKLDGDSIINLGCSKAEWKYRRGNSRLKIK